ncbi:thioredoxin-dependent thiol peroxidase [Porphyromonas sp.]|uniref:thioredoxin-dependent thiol peroxidase n=1 Tax=Porphyromonas sp. TaxID=1924944 RepID=UPI0026DA8166|nr:thioredoxin-dependent thiol peroxidase [Porphyromonas sp.]MDO4771927.1 thioredoxin-dependent thiol peroxidase [Porphyromonas sp.]
MIKVGDKIPAVLGKDQDGNEITAESLKGQKVILYFYPKDNTSGCTAQACSLRDGIANLKVAGYLVIGVSKDSAKSHIKFREQHSLPFALIADTDTELNQAFGVWVEKSMYGRKYMGTQRTTFVIDEEGTVRAIVSGKDVDTKEHAAQLLKLIGDLGK